MFQIITAFKLKLKLWQSQVKANNFIYFSVLDKYNPKNSKKYFSLILILIYEFETRFQDFRKNNQLFAIFLTPFSVDITAVETKFQMNCIELQSDIQLKEKFNQSSLLDFYKLYLPKETDPVLHTMPYSCSRFSAVLTFVNNCFQE
ncbi:general transcription factor II-I repeat domain-containing protein 2B-like [Aphis craccivora]|uniref:General transcription factor II-I repeat domain-containing protein 2B-like n=1 Tax=Aphis craccivora TaxID=307492 RepID=A0A6G0Y1V2_APHCR|nr:general transcription factor II-I repeat domain-containing protein 2B-like [Aphis craccivora]